VWNFFATHLQKLPLIYIRCRGTHQETRHRTVQRNGESHTESHQGITILNLLVLVQVTDFNFRLDCRMFVQQQFESLVCLKEGAPMDYREFIEQYTQSKNKLKHLSLAKVEKVTNY
jgi:hypothetical protein